MRRFLGTVLLGALAASLLAAGPALAAPAAERDPSPSVWQALVDLLRPLWGASEGDGGPEADPDGLASPPSGSGGAEDSGESDSSPELDPDG